MPAPPSPGAFLVLTVTDGRLEPLLWAGERVLVEPAAGRAARRGEVVAAAAPAQGLGSFALGRAGEFETARLVGAVRGVWRGGRWLALAPEETRLGRAALALLSTLPAGVRGLAAAESWAYGLCRFRGLAAPAAAGARAAGRAAGGVRRLLAAASAAASRPAAPRPLPRGLPPTANPAGRLEQDETWGGLVRVEGDLVVPAGVTLTLKAGAVLRFPAGPARLSAERRPRGGGLAPVHEAGKAALLVYGRLVAEGAPDAPVRLGGGDEWGGLHVLGDGRARLDGVELSGSVGLGLGVWDRGAVSARGLTIARCWDGAGVFGAGRLTWEGGGVSGARETSVVAEGGAAALTGLTLSGAPRAAVSVTGRARLSLRACRVSGGACGASARGGAFSAVDTRFDAQTEAGLDLEGGPHELSGVRVSGAGTGLIVSGRARAADLGVEAAGAGVLVRPGGALTWEGGWARGGEVGLCLQGGRAHVSGVAVAGAARQGLRLEGGRFTGIGLEIGRCGETGLLVEGDARARLADCLVLGGRAGAAVSSGRMRLEACRFEGQSEAGLELAGRGHVLERVRAAGAPRGLVLRGEARARDLVLEASGVGLEFHAGADLSWLGGAVRGGEIGVLGVGGRARLEGVSVSGARLEGLRLEGGRLEGRGLRLEGDGQTALLLASGEARLAACAVRGWGRGVAALRGRAVLGGCRFEGQRQAALELAGPQCHELRGVEVSGAQTGLVLTGRARVRGLAVSALATGVEVRPGGALLWQDGGATGGDRGLVVSGGRTTLSGVSLRGSRLQGLRAEGGEVTGRGLVLEGHGESGVLLAGGRAPFAI